MYSRLPDAGIDLLWTDKVAVSFGLQSDGKCRAHEPDLPFVAQLIPNNRKWFCMLNNWMLQQWLWQFSKESKRRVKRLWSRRAFDCTYGSHFWFSPGHLNALATSTKLCCERQTNVDRRGDLETLLPWSNSWSQRDCARSSHGDVVASRSFYDLSGLSIPQE